jgi:hypothetical protein
MSNRAKKISELTTANTITDNDYFILVANVAGTLTTRKLTVSTFRDTVTFPNYANATYAGIVKIGSQLAVNQDGLLSANIRAANTSSYGTVKVGSELAIDQNGFLVSNVAHATNSHTGVVAVGNNLTINATGYLSANIFIANSTVLGKVGVGDQLSINATGFLSANINHANTTSEGVVKVGNNLTINVSGHLSAVLPIANTTSPGMVSIGNSMAINESGELNINAVFATTTTPGVVIVGDQLAIDDETYILSANIRIANTTSAGIIKVGDNMVIDANGFLTANVEAASVGSASQLESNGFVVSISASNGALELPGTNNQISTATNFIKVVSEGVVQIKSDDVDAGFNYVTIGAERANSAYITILDDSNIYNWKFDKAGITTTPGHIIVPHGDLALSIGNSTVNTTVNSTSINTRSNLGFSLNWANNSVDRYVQISNTSVVLGVANPTADPTTLVLSSNNISLRAQEGEGSGTWIFKANGTILFPDNTVQNTAFMYRTDPPTAPDAVGIKGEFAIDNDYFYVCAGDGAWKRIAYDNTWV